MKIIRVFFILGFFALLLLPILTLNRDEDAVSEIDNKKLAQNPLDVRSNGGDFSDAVEAYISERLGFRNCMIKCYTSVNDVLFNEMVHPSYSYGKDGYVFSKYTENKTYGEYEDEFVDFLVKMQDYCQSREIGFVFVFEPSKAAILSDKLPDGYNYSGEWYEELLSRLDENNVNYVDNSKILSECYSNGISVFNVKYNAGHWNDMGAFYGMNEVLKNLHSKGFNVHINYLEEYSQTSKLNTTLPVSEFPISEYETIMNLKNTESIINITSKYEKEIKIDSRYPYFLYLINEERIEEGAPKTLVFQGSYINGFGYKFLQNGLGEYIAVHDYQNVIGFEYYINLFQPECVIFDAAEYTFKDSYFDLQQMKQVNPTPPLRSFSNYKELELYGDIVINKKEATTEIQLQELEVPVDYVYLIINETEYSMEKESINNGLQFNYCVTVDNNAYNNDIEIIAVNESEELIYYVIFD
ncbi:MAG: hypothetical protein E7189_01945 [Erysipelotrichaceae bacterium]|nr:hypothetical protein [Erysipelotrichaceae bacterium]